MTDAKYKEMHRKLNEAMEAYRKHFNEPIGLSIVTPPDPEEFTKVLYRCIETNTPFKYPKLPEGCIS